MLLADSNVWLALALSKHVFHAPVRAWLGEQAPREALYCRSTQQSFLRLLTTRAVLAPYGIPPLTNQAAWSVYDGLRAILQQMDSVLDRQGAQRIGTLGDRFDPEQPRSAIVVHHPQAKYFSV